MTTATPAPAPAAAVPTPGRARTHDEVLAACTALAPTLGARAVEAEELRRLPDATMADAAAIGLFELVVPEVGPMPWPRLPSLPPARPDRSTAATS